MRKFSRLLSNLPAAGAVSAAPALAAQGGTTLYVGDDGAVGGDGLTWDTCCRFLRDALLIASDPGHGVTEMHVAEGTYTPDRDDAHPGGTGDRAATFRLINGVTLMGGYAGPVRHNGKEHRDESLS